MAGRDFVGRGKDVIDDILHELSDIRKELTFVKNNKQPTMPVYDFVSGNPGDLPDDGVEGQYAVDKITNSGYLYSNGAWHKIGSNDAYPVNENASILTPGDDIYSLHWASIGTVDNLCLYNGYIPANGTIDANIAWRFMLGPYQSLHEFVYTIRTGPDYGIAEVFLASIPENDPSAGADYPDKTNILMNMDDLNWVSIFSWDAYSAVPASNVMNQTDAIRPSGVDNNPLTTATFTGGAGHFILDGGAGPYAMWIKITSKAPASSGYKFDIQDLHRKRVDWAWG